MFFIPGQLISAITFPGVIVHEYAHQLFCKITKTPVLDVCYFRFGNPAGYVIHEKQNDLKANLLITIGPFIVNNLLGILITLPAAIPVLRFGVGDVLDYFLMWLGVSILMHSFPSTGDAKALKNSISEVEGNAVLKVLCYPIVGLIYLVSLGSVVWLDYFYGLFMAIAIPEIIVKILAS